MKGREREKDRERKGRYTTRGIEPSEYTFLDNYNN